MLNYKHTLAASYLAISVQSVVNNFPPLLFLVFQKSFGISIGMVTFLVTLNFAVQLLTDLAATKFIDKIGYRTSMLAAHVCCFSGFVSMATLPFVLPAPYVGLVIATVLSGIGGGLIEVVISPLVEALPGERKAATMSLVHSFYCWGSVAVILLSTLYFQLVGIQHWPWLALLWAVLPLCNGLFFARVPLATLPGGGQGAPPLRNMFKSGTFLLLLLLMVAAGASEQAMVQWASFFAEAGLSVSKTVGDLLGPCTFFVLMGTARVVFGLAKRPYKLENALAVSAGLCAASYLLVVFAPHPLLSLLGCGLCGLSVGIVWPGSVSLSAKTFPVGGAGMFALLALAGDVGCSLGPGLVGAVSGGVQGGSLPLLSFFKGLAADEAALKTGLLCAAIFPLLTIIGVWLLRRRKKGRTPPPSQPDAAP